MMPRFIWASLPILFLFACKSGSKPDAHLDSYIKEPLSYATAFEIYRNADDIILRTTDGGSSGNLVQCLHTSPDQMLSSCLLIPENAPMLACLSTSYLGYLIALDIVGSIAGISNQDLVYNEYVKDEIQKGQIQDLGNDLGLNYERMIELSPDFVLYYDFGPSTSQTIEKMASMGLKVIEIGEFLERHPLGKAEWIKFFGILMKKEKEAKELYAAVEKEYLTLLSELDQLESQKPKVFTGLPWKGEWYQPGGNSFQAKFIENAGGKYLWEEDSSVSGMAVDREVIYDKALEAEVWINPGDARSLAEITAIDGRFEAFRSFRDKGVYNNNLRLNNFGGNDYWESGPIQPQIILKDLLKVFHPEVYTDHEFYYYQQLN